MSEADLVARRAKLKEALRAEFIFKQYNPYRFIKGNEPVFDPAAQRWISMKACQYDYFKPTPKTSLLGLLNIIPIAIFTYVVHTSRSKREHLYRTGQVAYRDRDNKFV